MTTLTPGARVTATTVDVPLEPVPADQVVAGSPATGSVDLDEDLAIGVWEMSAGSMRDVEIDEVFVVLSGRATIEFERPALPAITIGPGDVVQLEAGMNTVWTVTETLRKLYLL